MRTRFGALPAGAVVAVTLVFGTGGAQAIEPLVRVTACDPIQVGGHAAQRLTLAMAGQTQFFDTASLRPVAKSGNDTCSIVEFTAPPGWTAFRGDLGDVHFFGTPVPLGQSLDGFQIVVNDIHCCYEVGLENFLLLDGAGYGIACFNDCAVTPARRKSWGALKVIYR